MSGEWTYESLGILKQLRFLRTEQGGEAGSVDVGIQKAHPQSVPVERECKIDRGGGFSHPAFATGNRKNSLYPCQCRESWCFGI
jgi:hypothetical protein